MPRDQHRPRRTSGLTPPPGLEGYTRLPGLGLEFGTQTGNLLDYAVSSRTAASVLERLDPIERFAMWFYLALAALMIFFAGSIAATTKQAGLNATGEFLLAAGASYVVAISAAAVGCLLGFLFGIPRSQRGSQIVLLRPAPPAPTKEATHAVEHPQSDETITGTGHASASANAGSDTTAGHSEAPFRTNTSLEEISDWLTKIIIGLGLVQFQTFIEYLYTAAKYAASFVAHKNIAGGAQDAGAAGYDSALATPFFVALIITSLISACVFTYLETRTRLTLLFVGAAKEGNGVGEAQQQ